MIPTPTARLRLTVLGCSTAAPHAAWPAAGYLVDWGDTSLLLDVGQGVIRRLQRVMDPTDLSAIVIGHMHADHYLDLVGLRYLFPWGEAAPNPIPVHLPPGGRARLDALATAVSERSGFFDAAFDATEYDPSRVLQVGDLTVRFIRGRHYVPAWGVMIEAPDGARLAYTGDTGPNEELVETVRGVDLLLLEAALRQPSHDDPKRGHLTAEEAIDIAERSGARSALLCHYAPARRPELEALCSAAGPWIKPAVAGLTVTVTSRARADGADGGPEGRPGLGRRTGQDDVQAVTAESASARDR
jgi:ribonuclease BN (tRNA processing enzyme)